ncbi:MAG: hypothetical protein ACOC2U_01195, partial [bacterium]
MENKEFVDNRPHSNITAIIPVHKYNDEIGEYLKKALKSIEKQDCWDDVIIDDVFIVCPKSVYDAGISRVSLNSPLKIHTVINEGNTDYQSQVNLAVEKIETDYFSVLEFDDEYGSAFFKNGVKYIKAFPDVDVFLTMMIEVNEKNEAVKLTNETFWAQQFVGENGEMGYLNLNALKQYTDFKMSGAIIKKSEFENLGKYKSNIKLTFMYEFLLRALNNACKVYSIPKIGYKHLTTRNDSLFNVYQKEMSIEERKFWFDTAGKESNFTTDREID